MIALAEALRNARLAVISAAIDAGSAAGKLLIYSGTKPAPGAAVTTQVVLSVHDFSTPSASITEAGILTFGEISEEMGIADGLATWVRFADSDGTFVLDGDVGDLLSTAFIKIDNPQIYTGGIARPTAGVLYEP